MTEPVNVPTIADDYAALAERWGMTPAQVDAWPPDVVHWAASLAAAFTRRDAADTIGSRPRDHDTVDCHLTHPVTEDDALAWARTADWFFKSYYKVRLHVRSLRIPRHAERA